jgi:hypothetical protein
MKKLNYILTLNVFLVLILMGFYASQIVSINEYDYEIRGNQRESAQLRQAIRETENVYASSSSLGGLWPMINDLELEEVKEITYINIGEETFAVSR